MVKKIVQKDDPVLRKIAQKVSGRDFGTPALKKIIKDMTDALEKEDDGVAIAAPQINISKRIFIVSHRAFEIENSQKNLKLEPKNQNLVCINPEIISMSKDRKLMPEGCLSVRWLYGNTRRASRAKIKAYDFLGNEFTVNGTGLLAQIFQHETDHLNGILFTDHAKDVKDIQPETLMNNSPKK